MIIPESARHAEPKLSEEQEKWYKENVTDVAKFKRGEEVYFDDHKCIITSVALWRFPDGNYIGYNLRRIKRGSPDCFVAVPERYIHKTND